MFSAGHYIGNDIEQFLINMDKDFSIKYNPTNSRRYESLSYKEKNALVVINYQPVLMHAPEVFNYQTINLSTVKSIYINENTSVIAKYIDTSYLKYDSPMDVAKTSGCVVFIETYPEGEIPSEGAKGVRKTWLDGYSNVKEFYIPNYSAQPEESDYHRTLYWNPAMTTDSTGIAKIRFYNNGSCKKLSINAETVTQGGRIGLMLLI